VSGGPLDRFSGPLKTGSEHQSSGSVGLARSAAGWSGGKFGDTGQHAELAHNQWPIPPSFFLYMKTPSPVNLSLNAYILNISLHKT
jgi:hypothetical protein